VIVARPCGLRADLITPAKQAGLFDPADSDQSPPPCTAPKPSSPLNA